MNSKRKLHLGKKSEKNTKNMGLYYVGFNYMDDFIG